MPNLLCFGDSNTWGCPPMEADGAVSGRMGPDLRWPGVALAELGGDWTLVEEGLPGRTTRHPCALHGPHMDGRIGLFIALQSHGPIDAMTLMLGTNDLKSQFEMDGPGIARDLGMLLDICYSNEMQDRHDGFEVLLIAPPAVMVRGYPADQFEGAEARQDGMVEAIRAEADARDVAFLDAGAHIASSDLDGIHFGPGAHGVLGRAVAAEIMTW